MRSNLLKHVIFSIVVISSSPAYSKTQRANVYLCLHEQLLNCRTFTRKFGEMIAERKDGKLRILNSACTKNYPDKNIVDAYRRLGVKITRYCNETFTATLEGDYILFPGMELFVSNTKLSQSLNPAQQVELIARIKTLDGVDVSVKDKNNGKFFVFYFLKTPLSYSKNAYSAKALDLTFTKEDINCTLTKWAKGERFPTNTPLYTLRFTIPRVELFRLISSEKYQLMIPVFVREAKIKGLTYGAFLIDKENGRTRATFKSDKEFKSPNFEVNGDAGEFNILYFISALNHMEDSDFTLQCDMDFKKK